MSADHPSPNHGDRRGQRPELIVLHHTGMADTAAARARLCDPTAEVSAHWLVYEDGRAEALVPENRRAWHAGAGSWQGRADVNSRSIGIEIANPGDRPFPSRQMDGVASLLRQVMARWGIGAQGVIGHSDMAPDRKSDPGPRFDWNRLACEGLALAAGRGRDTPLEDSLSRIGYPLGAADQRLAAFRLRFRPWASGPETEDDRRIAAFVADRCDGRGAPPLSGGEALAQFHHPVARQAEVVGRVGREPVKQRVKLRQKTLDAEDR